MGIPSLRDRPIHVKPATHSRTMLFKSLLVSAVAAATATLAAAEARPEPWYCHGIDCPTFTSGKNVSGYELRHYPAAWWSSTNVTADTAEDYEPAMNTAFGRLFDYISGNNAESAKIAMTAPVLSKLTPGEGPFCSNNITVSFFMPFDFQDNPPQPNSVDCFLTYMPAMDVYVSSFVTPPPAPDGDTVISQAYDAVTGLSDEGVYVTDTPFFVAAYDPPFRLNNRHDEIWLLASSTSSSSGTASSRKLKL